MVFGNVIYYYVCRYFPILGDTVLYIISLRPVISFIIMSVFFTIMYVVLPNRKTKKAKFAKQNKKILNELEKRKADEQSVIAENKSALNAFRKEVKELLNKKTM